MLGEFWELWGPTEFWDEASNKGLVELNRNLRTRYLVISLQEGRVEFEWNITQTRDFRMIWAFLKSLRTTCDPTAPTQVLLVCV